MATAKRPYHHGNLPETLIRAGLEVIAEKGVRALTLREIGIRAGVSRMAAYRHFSDKNHLLFAISEAGFTQFARALEEAKRRAPADFPARITAMALAYVRFATEHPAYYEVMFAPGREHIQPGEAAAHAFDVLEQTIREGQQSGHVRLEPPVTVAKLVWSVVHGISSLATERDPELLTRFCSEVILDGLRPKPQVPTSSKMRKRGS